jgi:hypothetical protein
MDAARRIIDIGDSAVKFAAFLSKSSSYMFIVSVFTVSSLDYELGAQTE